jgi:hypothetical protein
MPTVAAIADLPLKTETIRFQQIQTKMRITESKECTFQLVPPRGK